MSTLRNAEKPTPCFAHVLERTSNYFFKRGQTKFGDSVLRKQESIKKEDF